MDETPDEMKDPLLCTYHTTFESALDPTEIKAHRRRHVRNSTSYHVATQAKV